jgi:hypothetical protein
VQAYVCACLRARNLQTHAKMMDPCNTGRPIRYAQQFLNLHVHLLLDKYVPLHPDAWSQEKKIASHV